MIYAGTRGYLDALPDRRGRPRSRTRCWPGSRPASAVPGRHPQGEGADAGPGSQLKDGARRIRHDLRLGRGRPTPWPAVKEMRTRIGSVKSTQKITKALQMVAAAKLRRAQDAAESARPYAHAHGGGDRQPGGRRLRRRRAAAAGRHRLGASANWSSWRPPTAAWPAASTPPSCAPRASRSPRLIAEGKDVKIITIGRKARDQLRAPVWRPLRRASTKSASSPTLARAQPIGRQHPGRLRGRRVRRGHPVLQPLPVGGEPDPDAPAADPGPGRRPARAST